ncbi:MAG: heat-inducible transcriptional repressor HrcA [Clostridiales bacterium]|nr:heat-inducible transcriptional repressor HrcA [Clostridiales bacterium]
MLGDRKLRILEAIINDYILTAEPIGSRTIAKKYNIGISSATIRNEMSDLEEMGLIIQPHASAGRIPSDKGYRLYVDALMESRDLPKEQADIIYEVIFGNINRIDYLMRETARAVSAMTNYVAIAAEPTISGTNIRHTQLVPIDSSSVLLVVITDAKAVRNLVLAARDAPCAEVLAKLSEGVNERLAEITGAGLPPGVIAELAAKSGADEAFIITVAESVRSVVAAEDDRRVYLSGVKNILALPEFSDLDRARAIVSALDERSTLITLLESGGGEVGTRIIIGSENGVDHMRGLSLIKANYRRGGKPAGVIGIIGPTRMDYPMAVAILRTIVQGINEILGDDRG